MTRKLKSKAQSRATTIDQLPIAQSRVEEYLSYLSGKSTVLADLPKPQSRTEEFLEYLCYNRGTGGGGGPIVNQAINIIYSNTTSGLTATNVQAAIDELKLLMDSVDWDHLSYVKKINNQNLFDKSKIIDGEYYEHNGNLFTGPEWCRYVLSVTPDQTISIAKKLHDSTTIAFLTSSDSLVSTLPVTAIDSNGWKHYKITVPSGNTISKVSINIHKPTNSIDEIMIYDGHDAPTVEYTPFTNGREILIDSDHVASSFDNHGTDLSSQNIHDAVKEVYEKSNVRPKKSFIVCVAGQSNAVGYDESPINPYISKNRNPNRLRQLGIYGVDNLKNIPLGHHAHSFQNMTTITGHPTGTKGIHLPLGNLLLDEIPEDYEIVFLSMSYGGTGFTTTNSYGTYNQDTMLPSSGALRWGVDSAYYKAMKARIQYLLDLNPENVFGGVIWIQGEHDQNNASGHKTGFETMTEDFFTHFNNNGYGNRVARGFWDKNLWYNVETVNYWYHQGQCSQIWNQYREWNPSTYVEIPRDTDSNEVNGTGRTTAIRPAHFGNDAYTTVIAPRVFKKMIENGTLFNHDVLKKYCEDCVEEWSELEHISEDYEFYNNAYDRFEIDGCLFETNGNINGSSKQQWDAITIPVKENTEYFIYNKRSTDNNTAASILGSSTYCEYNSDNNVFNSNTFLRNGRITNVRQIDGKNVLVLTTGTGLTHLGLSLFNGNITGGTGNYSPFDELVICESEYVTATNTVRYVEHKEVKKVNINGEKVDTTFTSSSGLSSVTVAEALDELNIKVDSKGSGLDFDPTLDARELELSNGDFEGKGSNANVTLNNGVLSFDAATLFPNSNVDFPGAYKLEFEATRGLYWFAFRGDYSSKVACIGIGGHSSGRIVELGLLGSGSITEIAPIPSETDKSIISVGDKFLIHLNYDGYIHIHRKKVSETKYKLYHKFDTSQYTNYTAPTDRIFGFICGISNNEPQSEFRILENAYIQKNKGYTNNQTLDAHIYNKSVDVFNELKDGAKQEFLNEIEWEHLDFVEYRDTGNLFNKNKLKRGQVLNADGTIGPNNTWSVYWSDIRIKPGDTFIVSRIHTTTLWFVDMTGGRIVRGTFNNDGSFTVPNNQNLVGFVFNVPNNTQEEDVFMLYRGNQLPSAYEPYTGDYCVTFPHLEFKFGFNNEGRTALGNDLQTAVSVLATMVTGQNPIGELKTLSQNEGESTTINGRTWIRCDGQTVSSADYSELYQKIGSQFTKMDSDEVENETKSGEDGDIIVDPGDTDDSLGDVEIVLDFNLPTNPLPIGYLYICAK